MIRIQRITDINNLNKTYDLIVKYFKPYEIVSNADFIYYAENYKKQYDGEDYFVYKIVYEDNIIGMLSGVNLTEFVMIDYFVIDSNYRHFSKDIMKKIIGIMKTYGKPLVVEAETEGLCRLYQMNGFKRFKETYTYVVYNSNKLSSHKSNLLYMNNDTMDFDATRKTIYDKYYIRWNSKYGDDIIKEYKLILNEIL